MARFLKMVRASLDRQIDTTVVVASCFPLVSDIMEWWCSKKGRKKTNIVIIEKCRWTLFKCIYLVQGGAEGPYGQPTLAATS